MSKSQPVKVFILYCKDQSVDDYCNDVVELSKVLVSCGGIECYTDFFEKEHQQNWNSWTEKKIRECDHVIMVCSLLLYELLFSEGRCDIPMLTGKFFSDTVVNSIIAPKFVPVFLNEYESKSLTKRLPSQLHSSRHFCLPNLKEFYHSVFDHHSSLENRSIIVSQNLGFRKFRDVASLVQYIRHEDTVPQPEKPQHPIPVSHQAAERKPLSPLPVSTPIPVPSAEGCIQQHRVRQGKVEPNLLLYHRLSERGTELPICAAL